VFYAKLMIFFLIGIASSALNAETIRIATGEYPPFLSENLKHNGVGLHIIKEAFSLKGISVEYGFFPWARAYKNVKQGKWDASATWSHKPKRDDDVYFSNPLYQSTFVFFHLKSYPFDWETLDDLKEVSIGGTRSYTYTPEFYQGIRDGNLNVEFSTSDLLNFRKLLGKRHQIFPANIHVGYHLLEKNFTAQEKQLITHHHLPLSSLPTHIVFSKANKKGLRLRNIFNEGLKELRESGRIAQYFIDARNGKYLLKQP